MEVEQGAREFLLDLVRVCQKHGYSIQEGGIKKGDKMVATALGVNHQTGEAWVAIEAGIFGRVMYGIELPAKREEG